MIWKPTFKQAIEGKYAESYAAANDYEQAAARVFQAAKRMVEASPLLSGEAITTSSKIEFLNGATIHAIASDYAGASGSNASCSAFDELWAFVSEKSHRLWDELVPPPTRPRGCRLVTTYAGFEGESTLLEGLCKRGLKGKQIAPDLWATDDGLLMFWTHEFVAPWQSEEWREQMRSSLRPNQYLRMIENRFVSGESSFVDLDWWDACVDPEAHPVVADPGMDIWIGVDASLKHDNTAIVACGWDEDEKRVRLVWHRVFKRSKRDPLDFENTIEAALLELRDRFSVRQIHFDPWQMASVSQRLERAGLPMTEFPQSVPRLTEAGQNLYELIKGRGLIAYRDEGFRRAISQSVAIESTRGWRIGKATGSHKVDLTVALAMACLAAVREGPSVEITADMLGTCGESAMAQVAERAKFEGNREAMMWSEPIEKPWERDSRNAAIPRPIIIC